MKKYNSHHKIVQEPIYYSKDLLTSTWIVSKSWCRIQTSNTKIIKRIKHWKFASITAVFINSPSVVFIIPRKKWKWAMRLLEINGPHKNLSRLNCGHKIGKRNLKEGTESPGQKSKFDAHGSNLNFNEAGIKERQL